MDPITQKLFMASAAPETFPGLMVEDVFGTDVYMGMGSGYDSPFASGFTTNYGKDGYCSTYFGGSNANGYIDFTGDSSFVLGGDFTIEMFVKGSTQPGNGSPSYLRLFQLDGPTLNSAHQNLQITMTPNDNFLNTWAYDGNSTDMNLVGTTNLMDGNWHHICVMRYSNGTMTQFVDGNAESYSTNGGTNYNPNGGTPRIRLGAGNANSGKYQGYISNFRITVGSCAYGNAGSDGVTGFTPPTAPLTGGTMRALYSSRPFIHSMPATQGLSATVENTVTHVNTPRLLCEDIDWTEGGLLWLKCMSANHQHRLYDTERDVRKFIRSDSQAEELEASGGISHWTAKGASHSRDGDAVFGANPEETAIDSKYAAWGFRKSKRFFDVIKWDGDNVNGRTINHNLKIEPGVIMIKCLSASYSWQVYHRNLGTTSWLYLDDSVPAQTSNSPGFGNVSNESFNIGNYVGCNATGQKYVAYVFAHDPAVDGIIKCDFYTGNATQHKITLGWEPQYVMIKDTSSTGDWWIYDAQRGGMKLYDKGKMGQATQTGKLLYANTTNDQQGNVYDITTDATGFWLPGPTALNEVGRNYVYMAIRKGPMRTPTDPKKVFAVSRAYGPNIPTYLADFPPDVFWDRGYMASAYWRTATRKMGFNGSATGEPRMYWDTAGNAINDTSYNSIGGFTTWDEMKGARYGTTLLQQNPYIGHMMRRAPGFFDTVGYIGDAASVNSNVERAIPHNLGVKPEMIIIRTFGNDGVSGTGALGLHKNCGTLPSAAASPYNGVEYSGSKQIGSGTSGEYFAGTTAKEKFGTSIDTATDFYVGTDMQSNQLYYSYMAYMWATCPKISKVGYYIATGSDMNIDCNFDNTARFVIINKWNSESYYCYDSIRGIVSTNDPFLYWNNLDAQNDNNDYIDPYSYGFSITSSANTTLNVTGHYYFYLAIA